MLQPIEPLMFLLEGKKDLVVAELGVFLGGSTLEILNRCNIKKYYAVDLWEFFEDGMSENLGIPQYLYWRGSDQCYKDIVEKLKDFPQVEIIRESTHEAHRHVKDNELDFCWIDANHSYDYVYKDIELWLPKVKEGGVISGDDWNTKAVKVAVKDFFKNTKYKLIGRARYWWVRKI